MSQKLLNEKMHNKLNDVDKLNYANNCANNDLENSNNINLDNINLEDLDLGDITIEDMDLDLEGFKNELFSGGEIVHEEISEDKSEGINKNISNNVDQDANKNIVEDANEYKNINEDLKRARLREGLEESALDLSILDLNYEKKNTINNTKLNRHIDKTDKKSYEKVDSDEKVDNIDRNAEKIAGKEVVENVDNAHDQKGSIQSRTQSDLGNMQSDVESGSLNTRMPLNIESIKDIENIEGIENKNLLSKIFGLGNRGKAKFSQKISDGSERNNSENKINLYRNLEAEKLDDKAHHPQVPRHVQVPRHTHGPQNIQFSQSKQSVENIQENQSAQAIQASKDVQHVQRAQHNPGNLHNQNIQEVKSNKSKSKSGKSDKGLKGRKGGIFVSPEMSKNYQDFISAGDFDMFTDIRKMPKVVTKKDSEGHRRRMREKVLNNHASSLHEYEIFEMLIHLAQPRKDSKQTAKTLLKRFSSMNEVFSADVGKLLAIDGMGAATVSMLKLIHELYCRLSKEEIANEVLLNSNHKVINYCRVAMGYLQHEEFRILFLNKKNVLIIDEVQQRGTIDQTPIFPREVVKRSIEIGASAIIMVHNHPSGDPTPSRADIEITNQVKIALDAVGIKLHDHIVIGKFGHISMKSEGMM